MSIEPHPSGRRLVTGVPPNWGEVSPAGETAMVIRFQLEGSVVTYPAGQFNRWEHARAATETLTIWTVWERIMVEGRDLGPIRAALDLGKLCEVRLNYMHHSGSRPGPHVRRIVIESSRVGA